jgi:hypothetical protein
VTLYCFFQFVTESMFGTVGVFYCTELITVVSLWLKDIGMQHGSGLKEESGCACNIVRTLFRCLDCKTGFQLVRKLTRIDWPSTCRHLRLGQLPASALSSAATQYSMLCVVNNSLRNIDSFRDRNIFITTV